MGSDCVSSWSLLIFLLGIFLGNPDDRMGFNSLPPSKDLPQRWDVKTRHQPAWQKNRKWWRLISTYSPPSSFSKSSSLQTTASVTRLLCLPVPYQSVPYIQILHVNENHWLTITASNPKGRVDVFDSPNPTKSSDSTLQWHVRLAKSRTSLGICPVWLESWLSAWRNIGSLATHWAHSEDFDQTRLI